MYTYICNCIVSISNFTPLQLYLYEINKQYDNWTVSSKRVAKIISIKVKRCSRMENTTVFFFAKQFVILKLSELMKVSHFLSVTAIQSSTRRHFLDTL